MNVLVLKIEDTDFQALSTFPLIWRWTDEHWNNLPESALSGIHPLSENKARELCQYSLKFSNQSGLVEEFFQRVVRIDASIGEADVEEKIRKWLLEQSSDLTQKVVVSWSNELAALVRWEVFCGYWEDFCYAASDDVAVFPLSEEWMLFYSHEEEFVFGER